jgi:hypothetical protein
MQPPLLGMWIESSFASNKKQPIKFQTPSADKDVFKGTG